MQEYTVTIAQGRDIRHTVTGNHMEVHQGLLMWLDQLPGQPLLATVFFAISTPVLGTFTLHGNWRTCVDACRHGRVLEALGL
jgi:hypothetical protein